MLLEICGALALLFAFASTARAGSITIAWDASPGGAAGYIVLFGTAPGNYTGSLTVGNQTTATVPGLASGQTYYFAVKAYSATGAVSDVSNEASGTTTNTPPQIANPGSQNSNEGASVNVVVSASDAEGDPLAFTATGLPAGLFIDSNTGSISGTVAFTEAGSHSVTVTVSDGATTASTAFTWSVQSVDRAATISPLPNQSSPVGAVVSLPVVGADPDGDTLLFSATSLPPGLSINSSTGLIHGTVGGGAGSYDVTVNASDGTFTATTSLTWTVLASSNPPTLAAPGNQESSVVNAVTLQLSASDADNNTLTYSASGLPPGLVLNPVSGRIAGQPTIVGTYPVTTSVSDGLAVASQAFTWTIDPDRPPTITNPGGQTSLVGQFVSLQIAASDPDGGPLAFIPSLPPGLSINDQGLITGIVPAGSAGQYPSVVTVSDGSQQASVTFTWTFSADTPTPPMFVTEAHFAVDKNAVGPNRADLSLNVSGVNTMLLVALHSEFDGGDTNWTVTDNGIPGTLLTKLNGYNGGANNQRFQIYYWLNPPQGANAIVAQNSFTGSNELAAAAILLSNARQTGSLGAVVADVSLGGRTSESETVATTASDLVVHVIADAQFNRGALGSGETSVSIANDGLQKSSFGDGDASLWISTKTGGASSTTVSSSGWPGSPAPAPRVMNGVAIVVHGAVAIVGPDLTITTTRVGSFTQGQTGTYTLTASNSGNVTTSNTVTVFDALPSGLSATAMTGTGWSCSVATVTCTRSDTLGTGASYPPITLTVAIAGNAIGMLTNTATVSGDEVNTSNDTATDQVTIVIPGAPAIPAFVQRNYSAPQSPQTSVSVTYTAAQSSSDLNVVVVGWNDYTRQVQSVVDSNGNTYTLAVVPTVRSGFGAQSIYYAKNINAAVAGANVVTVTFDAATAFPDIRIAEYTGVDEVNAIDVTAFAHGSSATSDSGAVTTTNASDLLVGGNLVETGTVAAGSGFTSRAITSPDGDILMDRVVNSIGSYGATATLSSAGQWIMQLVAFRAAGSDPNPPPTITNRTPATAPVGATVILIGAGFGASQGTSTVKFNGTSAGSTSWSDSSISAIVPVGATTGSIVVTVGGVTSNSASFTVLPTPNLTSRAPATGPVGTAVTIVGANFGSTQGTSTIVFNGTPATATAWSDTAITAVVPPGATTGNITVTVNGVVGNGLAFTVLPTPTLISRTPSTGSPGAAVTVTGTNFGANQGTSTVTFNGTAASPSAWSDTSVVVSVPTGATSGYIVVTVNGVASNGLPFTVNHAPTLATIANQTSAENDTINLATIGSVPDGSALIFTATGLPADLTINATTGVITGTLSYTSAGSYNVTVTISDGTLSANQSFSWTVTNVNRAPVIAAIGNLSTVMGTSVALQMSASDADGDTISYGATGLPLGVTIDGNAGLIAGAPSAAGVYNVTILAIDGSLSASASFVWTVTSDAVGRVTFIQAHSSSVMDNAASVAVSYPVAQLHGSLGVVVVGWKDSTAEVLSVADAGGNVYQLAVGPTHRPEVGSQSIYYAANIAAAAAGANIVTVTFTSAVSKGEVRVVEYQGIELSNVVDVTAGAQGNSGQADSEPVTTTFRNDLVFGAVWASTATTLPIDGLTARLTTASGALLEDATVSALGSYGVRATIDPPSPWITQMVAFRDANHAPVLNNPGPQTTTSNTVVSLALVASDIDGDTLTFSTTGLPPGLSLNASSGVISGTLPMLSGGVYNISVSVSDGALGANVALVWTVTAPTITASLTTLNPGNPATIIWTGITTPTATDWIGLYTPGAADPAPTLWWYTSGAASGSRVVTLSSTLPVGTYQLRLFGQNSYLKLAVSGSLTVSAATLTASPTVLGVGGTVTATWSAVGSPTVADWITLARTGTPDTSWIAWGYTTGTASGSRGLVVPMNAAPGTYELRLFAQDSTRRLAVSNPITVRTITVTAGPTTVLPGDAVTVTWSDIGAPSQTDWVTLVQTGAPDTTWVAWGYTNGASGGSRTLTMSKSAAPGTYEVRLFANNTSKRIAVSNVITVPTPMLSAGPSSIAPGGTLTVRWQNIGAPSSTDWLTLTPVGNADPNWVAWIYTTGLRSDGMGFTIPANVPAGAYEVRLFANNTAKRLAVSNAIAVTAPNPTLAVSPVSTVPGGTLSVSWRNIASPTATDWVGLYSLGVADADYVSRMYTNGRATDRLLMNLPPDMSTGSYELRLFTNDSLTRLATSNDFNVTSGPALSVKPLVVPRGGKLTFSWAGITSPTGTDWVALNPVGSFNPNWVAWSYTTGTTSGTGTLTIPAIVASGTYELRLFAQDGLQRLAVSNTINVGPTVDVTPTTVAPAGTTTIAWSGIPGPTPTDWVALTPLNNTDTHWVAWLYLTGTAAGSTAFVVPPSLPAGRYDVRLFPNNSGTRTALSNIITITAPGPSVWVSPLTASAGSMITASWKNIAAPTATDWIGVYPVGAADIAYITRVFTSGLATGSTPLVLPGGFGAGQYELRLFSHDTLTRLAVGNSFMIP